MHRMLVYLTIRQQGGVVYERIVDEGETWVNYLLIAQWGRVVYCFSINQQDWQYYIDLIILFVEEKRQ